MAFSTGKGFSPSRLAMSYFVALPGVHALLTLMSMRYWRAIVVSRPMGFCVVAAQFAQRAAWPCRLLRWPSASVRFQIISSLASLTIARTSCAVMGRPSA